MTHHLHRGDLPEGIGFGAAVAVDTEAMGLNPHRDRLCLVQLSAGDGDAHLVQFAPGAYEAPNLKALMADPAVTKLFHFARFDMAMLYHYLGVMAGPVYCTKIASRLVAHLYRPARAQGSVQGSAQRRSVEAAAELRLGRGDA
jgi:ribonuclease D